MKVTSALAVALGAGMVTATASSAETHRKMHEARDVIEDRSLASMIWDDIKEAATCSACESALVLLKGVAGLGDKIFSNTLTELCKLTGLEDDEVCEGVMALEGPILAYTLRKMKIGTRTSELFCATVFGLCNPPVDAWNVPFPSPKPTIGRPLPSGQKPIKIVHYSDIHVDHHYTPGSATNCSKPICCRSYSSAEAPGNNKSPAGPNGDHNCDAPVGLEESMYNAIQTLVPDAAFAIFTGDIVDHTVWNTTQSSNAQDISDAYTRMSNHLNLVYGTAGNHESSPVNSFPPKTVNNQATWLYNLLSSAWGRWVGTEGANETNIMGGYSASWPGSKSGAALRIISLNTNLFYVQNYWLYEPTMERDPEGQLAWLVSELDAAEKAGERVYIMGHMPFGVPDALDDGSNYLDQIVNRYSSTIAAMFFGHTHVDHFQISYSDYSARSYSNAMVASYIAPSLTPTSGMPSFRVYTVDPVTFAVLDHTTYMADMTDPAFQTTGPVWKEYYSAKAAYGPLVTPPLTDPTAELTAAFWHNVTTVFQSNATAFGEYVARKQRGWNVSPCTGDCVTGEICSLQSARAQDNCVVPTPGVHFKKRSENRVEERDECGISVARAAMGALVTHREAMEHLEKRYWEGLEAARV